MRIVFMGTPAFAAACLSAVLETEHSVVGVYTKPDTPKNRGMKLLPSEVKTLALAHGLPVYQPMTFRDDAVYESLKALAPDLIVAVAYGKILPQRVLDIPPLGCVNIHGSVLPALRGSAPVQWAVLQDLPETGVTAMYMSAGMDEGDIIDVRTTPIEENETAGELMERLAPIGAALLKDTLTAISAGTASRRPQDPALATYAPMLTKELSPVDWSRPARAILAQIRGLNPWPAATAVLGGTEFKLWEARSWPASGPAAPGTLLELNKKGLAVACGDGAILLTRLQAPGGKPMPAADYFRGHPIKI
ncbi:MAG: methionyl-tRNA formyltransferase [Oscillospiraceae bacterium]|nr:methionyl-tRNA formyltransferase [Oscillospiraceae bacterium]MBQ6160326.1 methionyl-tRNA formyltransferase [Oscillospiraceae bacterium]